MKKLIPIVALLVICVGTFAQGTLQFNQVLFINSSTPVTVPANKVWKVVTAMFPNSSYIAYSSSQGGSCSCGAGASAYLYTTASLASLTSGNLNINGSAYNYTSGGSVWLPAGSTLASIDVTSPTQLSAPASGCYSNYYINGTYQGCGPYTPPTVSITSAISVIEFNIIP